MTERRRADRYQLMFHTAVVDADDGTTLGHLVDISVDGLMIASDQPLAPGRRYRLTIPMPISFDGHRELRVRATSAWTAPALHPALHRNGFRDLELPPEQQQAFQRLVDEYRLRAAGD